METVDERAIKAAVSTTAVVEINNHGDLVNALHTAYCNGAENENHLHECMEGTFGQALESLKAGHQVARKGWNGKGMFLWLKPAALVKSDWCKDPLLKSIADANGGEVEALGTICMKTADGKVLTGWLASQTDMLSNDWILIN